MRCVVCTHWGSPRELTVQDLPDPVPAAHEVLIEVRAASVNFPDVLMVQDKYQHKPTLPFVPGSELAGVVLAAGDKVNSLKPGDRVAAVTTIGAFSTRACASEEDVFKLPPEFDLQAAAASGMAFGTAYHALVDRGQLRAGERVLVLGAAGGVGLAAVAIANLLGGHVIAAASSQEKLDLCRAHGARDVIDYSCQDLRERLREITGGQGVDVVVDPVGGDLSEPAFRSISWRGRYLVVGFSNGGIPRLALNLPLLKGASLVGVFWGNYAKRERQAMHRDFSQLAQWMMKGRLQPHIHQRYTLEQVPDALMAMASRGISGKLLVLPSQP